MSFPFFLPVHIWYIAFEFFCWLLSSSKNFGYTRHNIQVNLMILRSFARNLKNIGGTRHNIQVNLMILLSFARNFRMTLNCWLIHLTLVSYGKNGRKNGNLRIRNWAFKKNGKFSLSHEQRKLAYYTMARNIVQARAESSLLELCRAQPIFIK